MIRRLSLLPCLLLFASAASLRAQQACPSFTLALSQPITSGQPVTATINASYFMYTFSLSLEELISSQIANFGSGGGEGTEDSDSGDRRPLAQSRGTPFGIIPQ